MKHSITICLVLSLFANITLGQINDTARVYTSPYSTSFKVDVPITAGGIALTALGVKLINDKHDLTPAQLAAKSSDDIPFFDRSSAGFYSKRADDDSYIPFQASFAMPVLMALINTNERHKIGQVLLLYTETMAITGTLFTMSTGLVYRSRPYVYGTEAPEDLRLGKNSQRAFYAGHTAATAAATFFMAKTFQDFNPGSKATPYVWAFAASVPALVGYLRYKAGMHFLSDNLLGYAAGAAAGIFVPQLHRIKQLKNVSLIPQADNGAKGLAIIYHIR